MSKIFTVAIALLTLFALSYITAQPAKAGWKPLAKEKAKDQKIQDKKIAEAIANNW